MRRRSITLMTLFTGIFLVILSYFFLAAPLGSHGIENSNPRMQFAAAVLVIGLMLAFWSAVVYELVPDKDADTSEDPDDQ